jgi:hypothetical protein
MELVEVKLVDFHYADDDSYLPTYLPTLGRFIKEMEVPVVQVPRYTKKGVRSKELPVRRR